MKTGALIHLYEYIIQDKRESRYVSSTLGEYHSAMKSVKELENKNYLGGLIYRDFLYRLNSCSQREVIQTYLANYMKAYYQEFKKL